MQDERGTEFDYNKRHPSNVYSITINHIMVLKLSNWLLQINH